MISKMLELPRLRNHVRFKGMEKLKFELQNQTWRSHEKFVRLGPCRCGSYVHKVQQDPINWYRGVCKRIAHEVNYNDQSYSDFFTYVNSEIIPHLPVLQSGYSDDYMFEQWMSNCNYTLKRKNKMRELHAKFKYGTKLTDRHYQCKSFIKSEFYDKFKEARIINSRTDAFKSAVGGYIHMVQEIIMTEHYIKHLTPDEIANRLYTMSREHNFVYETDYSSFEGSFTSRFMLNVEFRMFEHVLQNYPVILPCIRKCYENFNVLHFQRKFTVSLPGSRMSGDMWTSLCNGFTNFCMVKYLIHKQEMRVDHVIKYDFLVEGDDGFIATGEDLPNIVQDSSDLGFQLKCDRKTDMNDLSFCGICQFQGILVPDILKYLNHYGYCCDQSIVRLYLSKSRNSRKKILNWIHSKALSLLAVSRGIPVLQSVAMQQIKLGGHFDPRYVDWWESQFYDFKNLTSMHSEPITPEMRFFVEKRFNIPVQVQIDIENELKDCPFQCYDIIF